MSFVLTEERPLPAAIPHRKQVNETAYHVGTQTDCREIAPRSTHREQRSGNEQTTGLIEVTPRVVSDDFFNIYGHLRLRLHCLW